MSRRIVGDDVEQTMHVALDNIVKRVHALAALEDSRDAARTVAVTATGGSLLDRIARMAAGGEVRARGTSHPLQALLMAVVLIVVATVFGLSPSTGATGDFQHRMRSPAEGSLAPDVESTATDTEQPRRRRVRRPASR